VWSFGVAAWQLLTDGDTPYFAIPEDAAVVAHVTSGGVLPAPEMLGIEQLWDAVSPCFALLPKDRPTFAQLGVALRVAAAVRGPPKIILCPITKKVMKDPMTLQNRLGSDKRTICFEATAVAGFVVRGEHPITGAKGWARYDHSDMNVAYGIKAVGDIIKLVPHNYMSVACAAWRDRHAVAIEIENWSGHGERPDRGSKTLDLDPTDTVAVVKAKISAFCKVPPEYQDLRLLHVVNNVVSHLGYRRLDYQGSIQEHPMFDVLPGAIICLMPPRGRNMDKNCVKKLSSGPLILSDVHTNMLVWDLKDTIRVRRPTVPLSSLLHALLLNHNLMSADLTIPHTHTHTHTHAYNTYAHTQNTKHKTHTNTTQHNTTQHNTTQHNTTRRSRRGFLLTISD
jgi:hypothetical protein